ncbi:hypothetical protein ACFQH5_15165 [Halomonas salifodinae]|uniref:DNA-binding protein n=1 Tax=Halomonas salifodinae TaxID=438745 RepID=A0ABW2EYR1_9GAMM
MHTHERSPLDLATSALVRYREGCDPTLIELPEKAVFPSLINAQPSTARKSRTTGTLLGRPAPRFVKHGRTVRYRLKDVLEWLESGQDYSNTAEAGLAQGIAQ